MPAGTTSRTRVTVQSKVLRLVDEHGAREVLRALMLVAGDEVRAAFADVAAAFAEVVEESSNIRTPTMVEMRSQREMLPFSSALAVGEAASAYAKRLGLTVESVEDIEGVTRALQVDINRWIGPVH